MVQLGTLPRSLLMRHHHVQCVGTALLACLEMGCVAVHQLSLLSLMCQKKRSSNLMLPQMRLRQKMTMERVPIQIAHSKTNRSVHALMAYGTRFPAFATNLPAMIKHKTMGSNSMKIMAMNLLRLHLQTLITPRTRSKRTFRKSRRSTMSM